jgi:3-oxoacyl-[acyl-carrier-protein] synthase-1
MGSEPEAFATSEKQSTGAGLTAAMRAVLPASPGTSPDFILCDLNGESYRAIEWGVAQVRLGERLAPERKLLHPAASWGDIGAATGGGLLALACAAFRRGWAPAEEATVFCGGDGSTRVAARLRSI